MLAPNPDINLQLFLAYTSSSVFQSQNCHRRVSFCVLPNLSVHILCRRHLSLKDSSRQDSQEVGRKSMESFDPDASLYHKSIESDAVTLLASIKHEEQRMERKRGFLMGCDELLDSEESSRGSIFPGNQSMLPESLLREDDVFHEDVKRYVDKCFGAYNMKAEQHLINNNVLLFDQCNLSRTILASLDDLTTNGLYHLAELIVGGSTLFEKTRWKMKKLIKENLSKKLENQSCGTEGTEIRDRLLKIIKDPQNFLPNHATCSTPTLHSHRAAVMKVIDGLGDMPFHTLSVMHRKLRGIRGGMYPLRPPKSGWSRDRLIERVRTVSLGMLSELGPCDELPEPLAKAMEVASLWFKLTSAQNILSVSFHCVSPRIEALQVRILKAISLLDKVSARELKNLKFDLKAEDTRQLRSLTKKMLVEFLFECGDMDSIPRSLLDVLDKINIVTQSKPCKASSEDVNKEEVECILNLSANIRQVLWDYLPDDEYDQEFADAYMEDLEDSGDEDFLFSDVEHGAEKVESIGCSSQLEAESLIYQTEDVEPFDTGFRASATVENRPAEISESQNVRRNKYVAIQDVSDETSLIAYGLIGRMLEGFARKEGISLDSDGISYLRGATSDLEDIEDDTKNSSNEETDSSVIVQAAQEVIPTISNSKLEKVKQLLSSE